MKSWKELPHLFSGGKFELCNSFGYRSKLTPNELANKQAQWQRKDWAGIESYQLIARPISDMSNSELSKAISYQDIEWEGRDFQFYKTWLKGCVKGWGEDYEDWDEERLSAECQNYLLSIGVYPFDQSHFESGEVIARYENGGGIVSD